MSKAEDPYYNRKPVPAEFVQDVGLTGRSAEEDSETRERKLSVNGVDVRKFWNSKKHYDDPYYGRKSVDKTQLEGVGDSGLSPEDADNNRERKLSVNGVDVRKFWNSKKHYDDPYYGRKSTTNNEIVGVGDTGMTKAEEYEVRERKQSVFQLDADPFSELSGRGHRASISAAALPVAQDAARRRSSINPNAAAIASSGQKGGVDTINSVPAYHQQPPANTSHFNNGTSNFNKQATTGTTEHYDPDGVDPMERR